MRPRRRVPRELGPLASTVLATRLANQIALVAALVVIAKSLLAGTSVVDTVEQGLLIGVVCWIGGYLSSGVLSRLAVEHVAALAGETAEVADVAANSPDRISARESNR